MTKYTPWLAKRPILRRLICLVLLPISPLILFSMVIWNERADMWQEFKFIAYGIIDKETK